MKKSLIYIGIFALLLMQISFVAAEHNHEHFCEMFSNGHDFGHHVAGHARMHHFSGEMNPGMHRGYSVCARM